MKYMSRKCVLLDRGINVDFRQVIKGNKLDGLVQFIAHGEIRHVKQK